MRRPFYHLTKEDREVILEGICEAIPLSDIAYTLGKSPTSISREVKRNRISNDKQVLTRRNICEHAKSCTISRLCKTYCRKGKCSSCLTKRCSDICNDFVEGFCPKTKRWPYVCNPCTEKRYCSFGQYFYRPSVAHAKALRIKSESRSGISISKQELAELDALVSPLLKDNKHSVEVVCAALGEQIPVSAQTLRRYIDSGKTGAIRLDLLSAPARRVRAKKKDRRSRHTDDGRSFADFCALPEDSIATAWEVDTVFGSKADRSCLLTLVNRQSLLLLAFKMSACDTENVVGIFDYLELLCKDAGTSMSEVFGITLFDNGTEFSDIEGMETSCIEDASRTHTYFCDPYSSWQKPHIENRHLLIRRISPKGSPLDGVKHDQVSKMLCHINSYPALSRGGFTPYELALETMPEELLNLLGIYPLPIKQVSLNRNLLDK